MYKSDYQGVLKLSCKTICPVQEVRGTLTQDSSLGFGEIKLLLSTLGIMHFNDLDIALLVHIAHRLRRDENELLADGSTSCFNLSTCISLVRSDLAYIERCIPSYPY